MINGTATGNDHINIDTLKAGEDSFSKTLAMQYTKFLSERRIPKAWKNTKMMIIFKKGNNKISRITDRYVYYQTYVKYSGKY